MSIDNTEGDFNSTPLRHAWQQENIDASVMKTLARDDKFFLHQSLSTPCLTEIIKCEGSYIIDASGRKFLDFHGNSLHQVGYSHPKIIEAIKSQLDELSFCPRRFTNKPAIELAEKLGSYAPKGLDKVLFAPGGTSAVGMAMKLARYATGRHKTISMWGTFHGASLDAISIGGESLFRDDLGPLLPGCFHVPWPKKVEDADEIEKIIEDEGDIGAIISEPMRCTTVEKPEDGYWIRLRELCDRHGVLLILDEIMCGVGRTGTWFACEQEGVVPDMITIAKGLAAGYQPIGALLVKGNLYEQIKSSSGYFQHNFSFMGHPVACAAGVETLNVIENEGLLNNVRLKGSELKEKLLARFKNSPCVGDVRGKGLFQAIEFVINRSTKEPIDPKLLFASRLKESAFDRGLICYPMGGTIDGLTGDHVLLAPPYIVNSKDIENIVNILGGAVDEVCHKLGLAN